MSGSTARVAGQGSTARVAGQGSTARVAGQGSTARVAGSPARVVPGSVPRRTAALRLVPQRRSSAAKAPFAVVLVCLLAGGLLGLLLLNTLVAQQSFRLHDLAARAAVLQEQEQAMTRQTQTLQAPGVLAARALRLGMVEGGPPAFLRLSDGAVLGKPVAGRVPAPPAPPVPRVASTGATATAVTNRPNQSSGTSGASTAAGQAPKAAGRAPATAGRAPTTTGRAPTTTGRAPTTTGRTPTTTGRTPTTAGAAR